MEIGGSLGRRIYVHIQHVDVHVPCRTMQYTIIILIFHGDHFHIIIMILLLAHTLYMYVLYIHMYVATCSCSLVLQKFWAILLLVVSLA